MKPPPHQEVATDDRMGNGAATIFGCGPDQPAALGRPELHNPVHEAAIVL
jgi:hypothetical protein